MLWLFMRSSLGYSFSVNYIQQEITHSHSLHIEDYLKDTLNTDLTGDYFLDTPRIWQQLVTRP